VNILARLSPKRERFVDEYLVDLNGTQACIRAGYSPKTANEQAARLLANVSIRARIDKAIAERSKRTGVNADRVIQELAKIAFVNASDFIDLKEGVLREGAVSEDTAVISGVKVKRSITNNGETIEREIKLADKIKALELLGKHLGMFTDKMELSGKVDTGSDKLDAILRQLKE